MKEKEKLALLEEIMELEEGTLSLDFVLSEYEEWDSLAAISFMAIIDERLKKTVTGDEIKAFRTVADAIAVMDL